MNQSTIIKVITTLMLIFSVSHANSVTLSLDDYTIEDNKDKEYNKDAFSGLNRVYLPKNVVAGKYVLTQDMISKTNTIYIIQYDYDLRGAEITIPEESVLDFQGGILGNGVIVGNSTTIKANILQIFKDDLQVIGSWNVIKAYAEWFGANGDKNNDDSIVIQKCYNSFRKVDLLKKNYYIKSSINLSGGGIIEGLGFYQSILRINAPIIIGGSGLSINDIQFLYLDTNNKPEECIVFQHAKDKDIYNITINRCLLNGLNNAITIKGYISNITFNECWFNVNANVWVDKYPNINGYHRKNIVFNNCLIDWTSNRIFDIRNSGIIFYGCYFGTMSGYTLYSDALSTTKFVDCVFEIMNEMSTDKPTPIIKLPISYFERCRFSSNRATNYYWFAISSSFMSIRETRFSDWSVNRRIGGLFHPNLIANQGYGDIVLEDIIINSTKVLSPKDIGDMWAMHYPIFRIPNGYGISIVEGAYNIDNLKEGKQYTLFNKYTANPLPVAKVQGAIRYLAVSDNYRIALTYKLYNIEVVIHATDLPSGIYYVQETAQGNYSAIIYISDTPDIFVVSDPNNILNKTYINISVNADGNIVLKNNKSASTELRIKRISI